MISTLYKRTSFFIIGSELLCQCEILRRFENDSKKFLFFHVEKTVLPLRVCYYVSLLGGGGGGGFNKGRSRVRKFLLLLLFLDLHRTVRVFDEPLIVRSIHTPRNYVC